MAWWSRRSVVDDAPPPAVVITDPAELARHHRVAVVRLEADQPRTAIPILQLVLDGCEERLGPDHPDTAALREDLANVHEPQRVTALPRPRVATAG